MVLLSQLSRSLDWNEEKSISGNIVSREELENQIRPFAGRFIASFDAGFDLWELGWGEAFVLSWLVDGYDKSDVNRMWSLIWKTKPKDWQRRD